MPYPIPKDALDDRLAFIGMSGSGKTYAATGAIETLLLRHHRVIHVDPLGVAWGLRVMPDGKTPSNINVVIFGGAHGDIPINDRAGALVGEAVATMQESCIIDLSGLGTKAAERRFMLGFLTALYRHAPKSLTHLTIDEADMFAPQKLLDKEADAAKLLGMVETIVRRGRVRGFIPWLITQRPAVLSKDVLSQAQGVVIFTLTAQHDHDAVGGWVEQTADRAQWKEIGRSLAALPTGEAVVWIPQREILKTLKFPLKMTFDSSRAPKRGEKLASVALEPLNIDKLKGKLATVEEEAKANDPGLLKAEIVKLKAEIARQKPAEQMLTTAQFNGIR